MSTHEDNVLNVYRNLFPIQLNIETTKAPINAGINPDTTKPSTNDAINQNKSAFITKVKRPRVSRFIGSVRINKIGFRVRFMNPRSTAIISAI